MYTYGYLREATMAHIDLEEQEAQDMNLLKKFPIWANEAMQAICGTKPNFKYFEPKIVKEYEPVVEVYKDDGSIEHRFANDDEKYFFNNKIWRDEEENEVPEEDRRPGPTFCIDALEIEKYNNSQNVYLVNTPVLLPEDYIAFAYKQAFRKETRYNKLEDYLTSIYDWQDNMCDDYWGPAGKNDYMISAARTLRFNKTGEYKIPYKAVWYRFTSAMSDHDEIDMPVDIFNCIPLYVASEALQIDYAQKAQIKRSEFEMALARVTIDNYLPTKQIRPIF